MGVIFAVSNTVLAQSYTMIVLQGPSCSVFGPLPLTLRGLNQSGQAVGSHWQCDEFAYDEGFIWSQHSGFSFIPRPDGVNTLEPAEINASGVVTGTMDWPGYQSVVFLYHEGKVTNLWAPPSGNFSQAGAINSLGDIAGTWGNSLTGIPTPSHALLIMDRVLIDLGAQLSGSLSVARDINDKRQVVGWMGSSQLTARAFLWDNGIVTDLGVLSQGTNSIARAMSNGGQIAGSSRIPNPSGTGFVNHPFLWVAGRMIDLGVLPGYPSGAANDINEQAQVVGSCSTPPGGASHGFIWHKGVMRDLNDVIPTDSGLTVISGSAINNAGQIAAAGETDDGDLVGLLLTPVKTQPNPADLNDDDVVNTLDLGILLSSWSIPPKTPACGGAMTCPADINGDGFVNTLDLGILLSSWTL